MSRYTVPSNLVYTPIVEPDLPVRDDPTTYVPRRSRANRLARLLRNAIVRGDVAAQLIVEGRIDALRRARVAPPTESGWTEAELREVYGK